MAETDRLDPEPDLVSPAAVRSTDQFCSILFDSRDPILGTSEPSFYSDLNLDQVVESVVAGRGQYDLKPFLYAPLRDRELVMYRQEVFRDLEADEVRASVCAFGDEMQRMRRYLALATKQYHLHEKQRWFLDAVSTYCSAVAGLLDRLAPVELRSRGLQALCGYLTTYASSSDFASLAVETRRVLEGLRRVRYTLQIKGPRITVAAYEDEPDYTNEIEETFARFRRGHVEDHLRDFRDSGTMNHVEARIAELVARLFPEEFEALGSFCSRRRDFLDTHIATFDREVQLYLAYLEYIGPLRGAGLSFCYPTVTRHSAPSTVEEAFDIALAAKLVPERRTVVRNSFFLRGPERILVITGPNQGGKTTFARMVGQLYCLAALGLPVPGDEVQIRLPDRLFTHFEQEEDIRTLRGKLDDELVRIKEILDEATSEGIVILNEAFASTSLGDAVFLGAQVLGRLAELGCLAVCVTFVDELASLNDATVSMVASVDPDDPSRRTFRVVRRPADGRAHAWALAEKYGLTQDQLRSRISR